MNRKKLYYLVLILSFAGYTWLICNYNSIVHNSATVEICLFKKITGIPCPSCGSTHALVYLLQGKFGDAVAANPLGIVLALALVVVPFWILVDLLFTKTGFYLFYIKVETFLKRKSIAIPAIILVLTIWILNIYNSV
jgi:hypothetical protein